MNRDRRIPKPESRWTLVDGLRMHARVSEGPTTEGSPTVVLVHGLVVSGRYMLPTLELLAPAFRVYSPDLPGFGKSEKPPRVLDVAGLSDALAAWMGTVGLGSAALVGNSLGCQIVADLAARRPDLVEQAVLQGPTMDPRARFLPRLAARFLLDAPREPLPLLPIELRDYWAAGTRRGWRTLRHALKDRIEEKLPCVRAPALVVRFAGPHLPAGLGRGGVRTTAARATRGRTRRGPPAQLRGARGVRRPDPGVPPRGAGRVSGA